MACGKEMTQMVPTRYHYKEVPAKCGQTGYDGHQLICSECQDKGVQPKPYDFLDAGEYFSEEDY